MSTYRDHTNHYFLSNRVLKLKDQHLFQLAVYIFKTLKFNYDQSLFNSLNYQHQHHSHVTRNRYQLTIPRFRASTSQNHIAYTGSKVWNSLPESIKELHSLKQFKNNLRVHLLNIYEN